MWCHKLPLQSWLTLEISRHLFPTRSHLPAWEFWGILSSALKSPTAVASDFKDNDQRFLSELKHQGIKKFLPLEGHIDFFGKIVTAQYSFQTSFVGELMNWLYPQVAVAIRNSLRMSIPKLVRAWSLTYLRRGVTRCSVLMPRCSGATVSSDCHTLRIQISRVETMGYPFRWMVFQAEGECSKEGERYGPEQSYQGTLAGGVNPSGFNCIWQGYYLTS